jgi:hypothetical protein
VQYNFGTQPTAVFGTVRPTLRFTKGWVFVAAGAPPKPPPLGWDLLVYLASHARVQSRSRICIPDAFACGGASWCCFCQSDSLMA